MFNNSQICGAFLKILFILISNLIVCGPRILYTAATLWNVLTLASLAKNMVFIPFSMWLKNYEWQCCDDGVYMHTHIIKTSISLPVPWYLSACSINYRKMTLDIFCFVVLSFLFYFKRMFMFSTYQSTIFHLHSEHNIVSYLVKSLRFNLNVY